MAVAAAAQSTAGGAVVTAAGGAADTFSGAAGGAAERFQWSCGWCSDIFSDFDVCSCVVAVAAAAQEHCRWCSGDSCRWCSRLYSVELQVVQQRDFSGAADGAAIFSAILMCAAAWWQWQQQHRALQVVQW